MGSAARATGPHAPARARRPSSAWRGRHTADAIVHRATASQSRRIRCSAALTNRLDSSRVKASILVSATRILWRARARSGRQIGRSVGSPRKNAPCGTERGQIVQRACHNQLERTGMFRCHNRTSGRPGCTASQFHLTMSGRNGSACSTAHKSVPPRLDTRDVIHLRT